MAAPPPITRWYCLFSGFLQTEGQAIGMVAAWGDLHRHASADTAVILRPWRANPDDLAELIWRFRPAAGRHPRIIVAGYSWGGWTATLLCRALARRGLDVLRLLLCDAVYRHWYALGQWRALVPWSRITVPPNVHRVSVFRQRQSLPRGHSVLAEAPSKTRIDPTRWLACTHRYADEAPEFLAELEAAT